MSVYYRRMSHESLNECVETDHHWQLVDEDRDTELVVWDLRRKGPLKRLRGRIFGPLEVEHLGLTQRMVRGEWWVKGWHRKWACAKCRTVAWDYEISAKPRPEVVR